MLKVKVTWVNPNIWPSTNDIKGTNLLDIEIKIKGETKEYTNVKKE